VAVSVRRRQWKDPGTGEVLRERWMIDFVHRQPDGQRIRIREFPPCDTKLDAMQWEQQIRKALADGTYRRGDEPAGAEVPTLEKFSTQFIESSEVHNKASTTDSKKKTLKNHLMPAFGSLRLDEITPARSMPSRRSSSGRGTRGRASRTAARTWGACSTWRWNSAPSPRPSR
jgi:hypothetical protein